MKCPVCEKEMSQNPDDEWITSNFICQNCKFFVGNLSGRMHQFKAGWSAWSFTEQNRKLFDFEELSSLEECFEVAKRFLKLKAFK